MLPGLGTDHLMRKLRISDQPSESITTNQRPRISDHIMRISDHISQISDHICESATMNQRPRLNDYMLTLKFGRCFFFNVPIIPVVPRAAVAEVLESENYRRGWLL